MFLAPELPDREHGKGSLYGDHAAYARIACFELEAGQAVRNRIGSSATVALEMHAEQSKITGFSYQSKIKITALVPVGDVRLDPLFHPFPNCCLDIALFIGEKMINIKQLERSGSAHRFNPIYPVLRSSGPVLLFRSHPR